MKLLRFLPLLAVLTGVSVQAQDEGSESERPQREGKQRPGEGERREEGEKRKPGKKKAKKRKKVNREESDSKEDRSSRPE